jgi:hypothetical protein
MSFLGIPLELAAALAEWLLIAVGVAVALLAGLVTHLNNRVKMAEALETSTALSVANARAAEADAKAADANLQASRADKLAAESNERAAANELKAAELSKLLTDERTARVNLERRTANRWLEPDTFHAISAAMSKFAGQPAEVVVFPVNIETQGIARLVQGILENAKWKMSNLRMLKEPPDVPVMAGGPPAPLMVMGVFVQSTGDPQSQEAGRALWKALSSTAASGIMSQTPLLGPPRVFVFIGEKPSALSIWVNDE